MAQLLEAFEAELEPRLPGGVSADYKALVRRKLNAFASDLTDLLGRQSAGEVKNGAAQDIEDRLYADTRNTQRGS